MEHIEFLVDFVGAELKEVGVEVLGIEQFKILFAKEIDQKNEGNFAGIGPGMKHAFFAEYFAESHVIECTYKRNGAKILL